MASRWLKTNINEGWENMTTLHCPDDIQQAKEHVNMFKVDEHTGADDTGGGIKSTRK
jgi:hypothetical protein